MRAFVSLVVAIVLATGMALGGLAATNSTKSGVAALSARGAASESLASLTDSPYLQLNATIGAGGVLPSGEVVSLEYVASAQHPPTDLSAAGTAVDFAEEVLVNGAPLVQVRMVGGELYGWIDLQTLAPLARGTRSIRRATTFSSLFGDRWFAVPSAFGATAALTSAASRLSARIAAGVRRVIARSATVHDVLDGPGSERVVVVVVPGPTRAVGQRLRQLLARAASELGPAGPALPLLGRPAVGDELRLTMDPGGVLLSARFGTEAGPAVVVATIGHRVVAVQPPRGAAPLPLQALRALAGVPPFS